MAKGWIGAWALTEEYNLKPKHQIKLKNMLSVFYKYLIIKTINFLRK